MARSGKLNRLDNIFNAVPVTGTKTASIDVSFLDKLSIVVEMTGSATTATVTPEASIDNVTWVPLTDNTLSVAPSDKIALFDIEASFTHVRISFDLIVSGGDTYTVDAVMKGRL